MFGCSLIDTILGGDAVELLGLEYEPPEDEDPDVELVLPDYAEIRQGHRRSDGVAG